MNTKNSRSNINNNSVRVWIGIDKHRKEVPYLFAFRGAINKDIEHKCRRHYAHISRCNYNDTRIIRYETFIAEQNRLGNRLEFLNRTPLYVEQDACPVTIGLF